MVRISGHTEVNRGSSDRQSLREFFLGDLAMI